MIDAPTYGKPVGIHPIRHPQETTSPAADASSDHNDDKAHATMQR
jgi:hypothetical protein